MMQNNENLAIFICCILAGFLSGFVFDVCRVMRKSFKLKKIMPFVDAGFWLFAICINYTLLYKSGSGQLRGFCLFGIAGGVAVYIMCFSNVIGRWMVLSLQVVKRFFSCLLAPFFRLLGIIKAKCVKIVQNIQKNKKIFGKKTLEKNEKMV